MFGAISSVFSFQKACPVSCNGIAALGQTQTPKRPGRRTSRPKRVQKVGDIEDEGDGIGETHCGFAAGGDGEADRGVAAGGDGEADHGVAAGGGSEAHCDDAAGGKSVLEEEVDGGADNTGVR